LNVECDRLAKNYWNSCTESEAWMPNKGFADEGWSVWIEGKKVTKVDKKALYDYAFLKRTKINGPRNTTLRPTSLPISTGKHAKSLLINSHSAKDAGFSNMRLAFVELGKWNFCGATKSIMIAHSVGRRKMRPM
jgi:hypothetical protein